MRRQNEEVKRAKCGDTLKAFKNWFLSTILDTTMVDVAIIFFLKQNKTKRAECGFMEAWGKGDKIIHTLLLGGVPLCPLKSFRQIADIKSMRPGAPSATRVAWVFCTVQLHFG